MNPALVRFPILLLIGTAASAAHAQAPQPTTAESPAPAPFVADEPSVAITISPVHLVIPMIELSAEIRVMPRLGVGVIAGAGATRIETTNELIKLGEAGVSPRYYVWGTFRRGVQLGAELLYLHAFADDLSGVEITASGLSVGPYVGYKWTHRTGFTFEAQGGVSVLAFRADSQMSSTSERKVAPLLNLQVGWSL